MSASVRFQVRGAISNDEQLFINSAREYFEKKQVNSIIEKYEKDSHKGIMIFLSCKTDSVLLAAHDWLISIAESCDKFKSIELWIIDENENKHFELPDSIGECIDWFTIE